MAMSYPMRAWKVPQSSADLVDGANPTTSSRESLPQLRMIDRRKMRTGRSQWRCLFPIHFLSFISASVSATVFYLVQTTPFSSDKQHLSYDDCLEVWGEYSALYCVLELCTVISTLRWAVLKFSGWVLSHWAHFTVPRFIVLMFLVFFVLSCHTACVLYYSKTVGWIWWD